MSQKITNNIFWLTVSRVFALMLLAIAYFSLFRYLQPFGSGQYQFVLSYVLLFSTVVDFGIQQYITKKISEEPAEAKKYFQNFFSFEIFVSILLYVVLILIAYFRGYDRVVFQAIVITGLGMVANALTYPFLSVMAAFQDLRKVALINFINSLVNISVIFSAIFFQKYIVYLASVQLIFGIIDLVLYRVFITKHIPKPEVLKAVLRFDLGLIINILKKGWPFALLVGFSAIYNRIDVLLITAIKGYTDTGIYTAAYKIFDLLGFFPSVVSFTLFPFFTALLAKKAFTEIKENLEKYLRLMIVLSLPMAVGGTILSSKLISIVAGDGYESASAVLAILIWAPAILFIYIPVNSIVISQLTKKALIVTGINVVINTIGNIILLPIYGIKASALMTVVSELIQGTFYFYFVNKNIIKFSFLPLFIKPILSVIIMGLVLWQIKQYNIIYTLPLGALIYFVMLVITGFLKREDYTTFKSMLKA